MGWRGDGREGGRGERRRGESVPAQRTSAAPKTLVQRLLTPSLMVQGRRLHLRTHVVITSLHPLRIVMHRGAYAVFTNAVADTGINNNGNSNAGSGNTGTADTTTAADDASAYFSNQVGSDGRKRTDLIWSWDRLKDYAVRTSGVDVVALENRMRRIVAEAVLSSQYGNGVETGAVYRFKDLVRGAREKRERRERREREERDQREGKKRAESVGRGEAFKLMHAHTDPATAPYHCTRPLPTHLRARFSYTVPRTL